MFDAIYYTTWDQVKCSSTPIRCSCHQGPSFPSCGWERYLSAGCSIGHKKNDFTEADDLAWFCHLWLTNFFIFSLSVYFKNCSASEISLALETLLGHRETEPKSKVPRVLILQSLPSWSFAKQTKHKGCTKSDLTTWFLSSFGHNPLSILAPFFLASLFKLICSGSFLTFSPAAETIFSAFPGRKYVWLTVNRWVRPQGWNPGSAGMITVIWGKLLHLWVSIFSTVSKSDGLGLRD